MVIAERRSSTQVIDDMALRAFARQLRGNVITPDDPRYDDERKIFNAAIDRRPAVIVQPTDAEGVVRAIAFAREQGLPISVRGGGHNTAGYSLVDDGLVIDLALRKAVEVDPVARVSRAGAGLRAGEYVAGTEPFGLVSPVGDASHTGLAGLTLGGGYGWLTGKHGMVVDNLLAVELVTADGRILRASEDEHPNLFWALRGGSGNFGVATSFEFRLHPLAQVLGGMLVYPFARAHDAIRLYREFTAGAPDEITTYFFLATMPDGAPVCGFMLCYSGEDMAEGERVIAPLRALGPVADLVRPMPYSAMVHLTDPMTQTGFAHDDRWLNTGELSDEALDALVGFADPANSLGNSIIIKQINGKARRVDPMATAFPHRNARYSVVPLATWVPGADPAPHHAWVQAVDEAIRPHTLGVYVNVAEDDSVASVFNVNYQRLVGVKNAYDPDNVFRSTYNIKPTRG